MTARIAELQHRPAPHRPAPLSDVTSQRAFNRRVNPVRAPSLTVFQALCVLAFLVGALEAISRGHRPVPSLMAALSALVLGGTARVLRASHRPRTLGIDETFLYVSWLHSCVVPLTDEVLGIPALGFRTLSDYGGASRASIASAIFVASICLGILSKHRRIEAPTSTAPGSSRICVPQRGIALAMVSLGLLGLGLRFQSSFHALFSVTTFTTSPGQTGAVGLVSTLARPLLPVGTYLLVTGTTRRSARFLLAVVLGPLSVFALASFSLNRAAIIVPFIAMLLTSHRFQRRPRPWRLISAIVCAVIAFFALGNLRTSIQLEQDQQTAAPVSVPDLVQRTLSVYGQSPYLAGVVFDQDANTTFRPTTPIASALSPVPLLGKSFRSASGSQLYNNIIYGGGTADQILPIWAELSVSWTAALLIVIGLGFGRLIGRLRGLAEGTNDQLACYLAIYAGLWLAQCSILSIEVLSQIAVYFLLPSMVLQWIRRIAVSSQRPMIPTTGVSKQM